MRIQFLFKAMKQQELISSIVTGETEDYCHVMGWTQQKCKFACLHYIK